jgi:hypothetical protein
MHHPAPPLAMLGLAAAGILPPFWFVGAQELLMLRRGHLELVQDRDEVSHQSERYKPAVPLAHV